MEKRTEFYDGILYKIEYKPELSNPHYYTRKYVYYVKTEDKTYIHSKKAINTIIANLHGYKENDVWFVGYWKFKNKTQPSISNSLHKYFEFDYNEQEDVYVYTLVEPYDD